jgi:hypothetical protein
VLRCPSRLFCIVSSAVLLCLESVWIRGRRVRVGGDVLRARKRSSERTAMAFMRRTETGGRKRLVNGSG